MVGSRVAVGAVAAHGSGDSRAILAFRGRSGCDRCDLTGVYEREGGAVDKLRAPCCPASSCVTIPREFVVPSSTAARVRRPWTNGCRSTPSAAGRSPRSTSSSGGATKRAARSERARARASLPTSLMAEVGGIKARLESLEAALAGLDERLAGARAPLPESSRRLGAGRRGRRARIASSASSARRASSTSSPSRIGTSVPTSAFSTSSAAPRSRVLASRSTTARPRASSAP